MSSSSASKSPRGTVGELLREWRGVRGMSQLDLALSTGVSSRHVSFIETGRSRPSPDMLLRLSETLEVPLRERNLLLLSAGFAPVYRESDLSRDVLAPVRNALELVLGSHEPFPAFVLDRAWNAMMSNRAHQRMLQVNLPGVPAEKIKNVVRLLFDPELLRPRILNWELVAAVLASRIRRELGVPGLAEKVREQLEALLAFPGVKETMIGPQAPPETAIVIPIEFDADGEAHSWFSTIATIGTPLDITLEELRIETLFPADDVTEQAARKLAALDE